MMSLFGRYLLTGIAVSLSMLQYSVAVTAAPLLESVFPLSCEPGKSVTVALGGKELDQAKSVVFSIPEITATAVDAAGVVTPRKSGRAELTIRHGEFTSSVRIEIARAETHLPRSFDQDIVPILTRRGCNGGGCHGKATGRGGFKLSLFGYDPESDFASITRDSAARRVTTQHGAASLLLQKPAMVRSAWWRKAALTG